MPMKLDIAFTLNGERTETAVAVHTLLIDFLRDAYGLRGVKRSCDMQVCGACTVLVDGKPVSSCTTLAADIDGGDVVTIEGLGDADPLDPVQQAFLDHNALQCGYCTPGFILSVKALLQANPSPSRDEIVHHLNGNLCRCTGYHKIIDAVESLART
jgi:aerobic-type carbon monoxide dehydrogenase small subunit (CoxS/CutS family)